MKKSHLAYIGMAMLVVPALHLFYVRDVPLVGPFQRALAVSSKVERLINISTDKAINPTSVMGSIKRVGEMMIQTLAAESPKTRFSGQRKGWNESSRQAGDAPSSGLSNVQRMGSTSLT